MVGKTVVRWGIDLNAAGTTASTAFLKLMVTDQEDLMAVGALLQLAFQFITSSSKVNRAAAGLRCSWFCARAPPPPCPPPERQLQRTRAGVLGGRAELQQRLRFNGGLQVRLTLLHLLLVAWLKSVFPVSSRLPRARRFHLPLSACGRCSVPSPYPHLHLPHICPTSAYPRVAPHPAVLHLHSRCTQSVAQTVPRRRPTPCPPSPCHLLPQRLPCSLTHPCSALAPTCPGAVWQGACGGSQAGAAGGRGGQGAAAARRRGEGFGVGGWVGLGWVPLVRRGLLLRPQACSQVLLVCRSLYWTLAQAPYANLAGPLLDLLSMPHFVPGPLPAAPSRHCAAGVPPAAQPNPPCPPLCAPR